MTKRLKKGDVVTFRNKETRWVIHSVYYGGEMVHMELENERGEYAYAIPSKSLVRVGE